MTQTKAMPQLFFSDVAAQAVFDASGPRPQFLVDSARLTVIVAGLEPGQQIPAHAESMAVYHFLAGEGVMIVDGETFSVAGGATLIVPSGAARGMHATTRLTFLAVKIND